MKTTSYYQDTSVDRFYFDAKFTELETRWLEDTMNLFCTMYVTQNTVFATNDNDKNSSDRLRVNIKDFKAHLNKLFEWIELRRHYTFKVPQRAAFTLAEIEFMHNVVINEMLDETSVTHKSVPKGIGDKLDDFRDYILSRLSPEHRNYASQG